MSKQPPKTSYGNGPETMDLVKMRQVLAEIGRESDGSYTSFESFTEQRAAIDVAASISAEPTTAPLSSDDQARLQRRDFFKVGGGAMALVGLTACTRHPEEKIIPYVRQPEDLVPGRPLFFATSLQHRGLAVPLLVESHMGRPTKIEGNPEFPGTNGGTNVFAQGEVFNLFDPDRSTTAARNGSPVSYTDVESHLKAYVSGKGTGVHLLIEANSSPTFRGLLAKFQTTFPEAKVYVHDAAATGDQAKATEAVFGKALAPNYLTEKADVILDLSANILDPTFHPTSFAAGWSNRRNLVEGTVATMSRLYSVETTLTPTGITADHRLALSPGGIRSFLNDLAVELGAIDKPATTVAAPTAAASPENAAPEPETYGSVEHLSDKDAPAEAIDAALPSYRDRFLKGLAADLKSAGAKALIAVGENLPVDVQELAYHLNAKLGAIGSTLQLAPPVATPAGAGSIKDLAAALKELTVGAEAPEVAEASDEAANVVVETKDEETPVGALLIFGANPAYSTAADLEFPKLLKAAAKKIPLVVHAGLYRDETAALCEWHIPLAHPLESWGDARSIDGSVVMQQPLIAPLYPAAKSMIELMGLLSVKGVNNATAYEMIRKQHKLSDDDWAQAIHDGFIKDTAVAPDAISPSGSPKALETGEDEGLHLVFAADPTVFDGRYANNQWLQELSKPVTTMTWDNAVIMSPTTADSLGLGAPKEGFQKRVRVIPKVQTVNVSVGETTLQNLPLYICPGHADNCFTLHLGYGRTHAGAVGNGLGFNAYKLLSSETAFHVSGATITAGTGTDSLALTQDQHQMVPGRALVRTGSSDRLKKDPEFVQHLEHKFDEAITLYPDQVHVVGRKEHKGNQWGMAIDLGRCVSCNACLLACASENNVMVVGKEQVMRGREMSWIRMDRYFEGNPFFDADETYSTTEVLGELDEHGHRKDPKVPLPGRPVEVQTMPVNCMQCELAPCETVCPVGATVHSNDGLNMMVYNRCVGTRYCSNNCPYKVRRFNFYQYQTVERGTTNEQGDKFKEIEKFPRNPNVTVRVRGVMEKCTYCVQRINSARIDAKVEDRPIADGEIKTACQQACPTNAIVFGDINDPDSEVVKYKSRKDLDYALLGSVNTRPRTTYLARIRNINQDVLPDALYNKYEGHH